MIILPDRNIPHVPRHPPLGFLHATLLRPFDGEIVLPAHNPMQRVPRPFLLRGYDRTGRCRWSGRFRNRDEAQFFQALGNHGLLALDREMWRLPAPCWDPAIGDALIYQFAISITDRGTASDPSAATCALNISASAGEVIVVAVAELGAVDGTLADATNGAYTKATSTQTGTSAVRIQLFYFLKSAPLSTVALTYTKAAAADDVAMSVLSATGVLTTSALDTAVTATTNGANANPPTLSFASGTPAVAGELFVACAGGQLSASGGAYSQDTTHNWATPFSAIDSAAANTGVQIAGGSQVNAGTSAITFNPTWSSPGASRTRSGIIVGFKAALQPFFLSDIALPPSMLRRPRVIPYH